MSGKKFDYKGFLSPFTWRYGSPQMREIFSEVNYRAIWRKIWVSLAEAQAKCGLVSREELEDLRSKMGSENIDIERAHEIEKEIGHDLMAEIRTYAEQCSKGGGKIHLGATSMDIEDNADVLRMREALDLILTRLVNCLDSLSEKMKEYRDVPCMGWTHLQPAEPTTLGYRFAMYAQDLTLDIRMIEILLSDFLKGKGIKGAVGTSASFKRLLEGEGEPADIEDEVMRKLGLDSFAVTTQTYPRKIDYFVLSALAGIAQSVYKFALDLRHLQSPPYGELSEPLGGAQVGSSAMPFKKNPIRSERICSLARYVSALPQIAWENAAEAVLERTLDDSANRRIILPQGFLAIDECLNIYDGIVMDLQVYPKAIERNLKNYGPFAGTEAVLMRLTKKGKNRQKMHERLREISSEAWGALMKGEENPLRQMLVEDEVIGSELDLGDIDELLEPSVHIGDAPNRCGKFLEETVEPILLKYKERIGERSVVKF
ncbi:hypothetical protein AKJ43_00035 [candidate division MSBL1 archaeon SCGC-AAA261D19]|uniref:Adenylosuccinate lyase n=1 Tax=candidate division MSBL1 archaeon SCGC-AAA261D19 TaxID=1698273 RepID=A0A133V8W1_9EURY|nr:hypothetical protein AKJ43_00035 [candidate division MSBL1 archaeon SCGC-AAA261D19]